MKNKTVIGLLILIIIALVAYILIQNNKPSASGWNTVSYGGYTVAYPSGWTTHTVANRYCGQGPNYSCDPIGVIITAPSGFPVCPIDIVDMNGNDNNPCSLYLGQENMSFYTDSNYYYPLCKPVQGKGDESDDIVFCEGSGKAHVTMLDTIFNTAYSSIHRKFW